MSLQDRFELGEILLDGPIRCYAARDVASGSNVLIHVGLGLRSDFLLNTALAHPLSKALLEQGQDGQTLYVVTERKEPAGAVEPSVGDPFLERRVWRTNPPPADARATPPAAPPAPPQPDSGTRGMQAQFFETSAIRERTHIGKKPDAIGDASQIFAAPAKKAGLETPGEFTQMFSSPAAHTPEPPDDLWSRPTRILPAMPVDEAKTGEEADAAAPGSVPAAQPGEFTRMFQAAPAAEGQPRRGDSAPEPASATPVVEPGEFTRMFQVAPIAETHTDSGAPATMPQPIPDAKPVVEPGEFTRMFQAPAPIAERHTDSGAPATIPQPIPDATPVVEPGEFTRMFQAPAPIAETHTDSRTPATTPQPLADAKPVVEPGEFTRMFQAPAPDSTDKPAPAKPTPIKKVETAPAAQPERVVEHGEFTRMFQAPPASTPRAELGAGQATGAFETPGRPAAREQEKETRLFHAPAPQQAAPGDFTAFFQRPAAPPSAPEPLPPPVPFGSQPVTPDKAPSSFTQFFQNPAAYGTPQAPPQQPQMQQAQPPTPGYAGPGGSVEATGVFRSQQGSMQRFPGEASEYTRMFEKPTAPAPFQPEPKAVQPAPAAPHKDNSKIILVVILSVLLLIAIGLVIFFALR